MARTLTSLNDHEVLTDMALVESVDWLGRLDITFGQTWRTKQIDKPDGYNVTSALASKRTKISGFVIYGSGGGNRWILFEGGRVCLSRLHAHDCAIKLAEFLGFEVI